MFRGRVLSHTASKCLKKMLQFTVNLIREYQMTYEQLTRINNEIRMRKEILTRET